MTIYDEAYKQTGIEFSEIRDMILDTCHSMSMVYELASLMGFNPEDIGSRLDTRKGYVHKLLEKCVRMRFAKALIDNIKFVSENSQLTRKDEILDNLRNRTEESIYDALEYIIERL